MSAGRRSTAIAAAGLLALGLLAACAPVDRTQSVLAPAGERADPVLSLWTVMLIVGAVVWVLVVAAMVVALLRRRRTRSAQRDDGAGPVDTVGGERRRPFWFVAAAGAIVPGIVILALTTYSISILREVDREAVRDDTMVEIIGHRYWWEIRYPGRGVTTANEIHIPVGQRVAVEVTSADVIHSFWVPELGGKIDMIPGRSNTVWLQAHEPGSYWGQCAEYCGEQHALMRVVVVAHDPAEFESWARAQAEPASFSPSGEESPSIERGREIFMSSSCVYCHTVSGTAAQGRVGPDLTHLASRGTLAAGVLPNTREELAAWLVDPQAIKPGNAMPGTDYDDAELEALLDYLESLQ